MRSRYRSYMIAVVVPSVQNIQTKIHALPFRSYMNTYSIPFIHSFSYSQSMGGKESHSYRHAS